jgi:hypothetical protein
VSKSKAGASRVVMWRDLRMVHSFTLEASFCGGSVGPMGGIHFTPNDFEEVGRYFCLGVLDLVSADQNAVYAALADVHRSLAGKRSLPPNYPPNLHLPAFAAINAAAAAARDAAASNFLTAGSGGGGGGSGSTNVATGGGAAASGSGATSGGDEKKDKKKKKKEASAGKKKSKKKA